MVKNYTKLEELNGSRDRRPFLFNNTFFVFGKIALFEKYFLFKKKNLSLENEFHINLTILVYPRCNSSPQEMSFKIAI